MADLLQFFFTENGALTVSSPYDIHTSCKKAKNSLQPFSRPGADHQKPPTHPTPQPTNGTVSIEPSAGVEVQKVRKPMPGSMRALLTERRTDRGTDRLTRPISEDT